VSDLVLIVNPVAGGGRAHRAAALALPLLGGEHAVRLLQTTGVGHARALAAAAVADGATRILVCGGDGTINEVASALAHADCALGILPFGRGNDLAAALDIPRALEAAVAVFLAGHTRRIDLGAVNGRVFCTVAATGFDAEVARRVRTGHWHHAGRFAYAGGVLGSLWTYRAAQLRLEGDFGVREGEYLLAAASNTGSYGGGIWIAPDARPDDGMLDCCLVRPMPSLRRVRVFLAAYGGGHVRFPEVEIVRTRELRVTADRALPVITDGELAGETPAVFGIMPMALRVITAKF
jgi:diacylglycerol kinase (ATP)